MNVLLRRRFHFEAAHHLPNVPADHPCRRVHGHSYSVEVGIEGPVDLVSGWLVDFEVIDQRTSPYIRELDHTLLNDVAGLENPTCEVISMWLWERLEKLLDGLAEITVSETANSSCTLRA